MWWNKKTEVKHNVNIQECNAAWVLNEELKRLHIFLQDAMTHKGDGKGNGALVWAKINELQDVLKALAANNADPDVKKRLADIQSHLADNLILGDNK